jgi:hypothetical protein
LLDIERVGATERGARGSYSFVLQFDRRQAFNII